MLIYNIKIRYDDFKLSIDYSVEDFDIEELSEDDIMTVIDDVCKYVSLKVLKNEDDIEVLWLTTKEGVKEHYLSPKILQKEASLALRRGGILHQLNILQ